MSGKWDRLSEADRRDYTLVTRSHRLRKPGEVEPHMRPAGAPAGGPLLLSHPVVTILDDQLSRRRRKAALAHELVHSERGAVATEGMPPQWGAVVAREENRVDDEVARWLVPAAVLREMLVALEEAEQLELRLEVWDVADAFDVSEEVAERAMLLYGAGRL